MTASLYVPTIHILFAFPLLFYIGYKIFKKESMNPDFGILVMMIAFVILLYHSYKFYKYYNMKS